MDEIVGIEEMDITVMLAAGDMRMKDAGRVRDLRTVGERTWLVMTVGSEMLKHAAEIRSGHRQRQSMAILRTAGMLVSSLRGG